MTEDKKQNEGYGYSEMSAISSPLTPATIWVGVCVGEWGGGVELSEDTKHISQTKLKRGDS